MGRSAETSGAGRMMGGGRQAAVDGWVTHTIVADSLHKVLDVRTGEAAERLKREGSVLPGKIAR